VLAKSGIAHASFIDLLLNIHCYYVMLCCCIIMQINGTACAVPRMIIAILENYLQSVSNWNWHTFNYHFHNT